ncbi:hypothetical protein [Brevifollis gellanilyticus]|uniref:hypothetical protein n=1 Tax=Brevifollis gellanilyticus TaxID=748831 RepID=UPI0011BE3A40|nr:hypothetical protein [Brevifollis gellanilyticus]
MAASTGLPGTAGIARLSLDHQAAKALYLTLCSRRVGCYVVPTIYRETLNIDVLQDLAADWFATHHQAFDSKICNSLSTPMWATFGIKLSEDRFRFVSLDRVDGHVCSGEAQERYFLQWQHDSEFQLTVLDLTLASQEDEWTRIITHLATIEHPSVDIILRLEAKKPANATPPRSSLLARLQATRAAAPSQHPKSGQHQAEEAKEAP